jgi:hypothetical protein
MNTFHLATVQLTEPLTVYLPPGGARPRVVAPGGAASALPLTAENGVETIFAELECAFWINVVTQTIHAQIARVPNPLLIYGPSDFAAVAADLPEHHCERVMEVLGDDPAQALQALCNGTALPPMPPRVPREIPNWRAKVILASMGLLTAVEAAIAALPEPDRTVASLAWGGDAKLARRGKTVLGLAAALGLSPDQIDQLFIAAEALEV